MMRLRSDGFVSGNRVTRGRGGRGLGIIAVVTGGTFVVGAMLFLAAFGGEEERPAADGGPQAAPRPKSPTSISAPSCSTQNPPKRSLPSRTS